MTNKEYRKQYYLRNKEAYKHRKEIAKQLNPDLDKDYYKRNRLERIAKAMERRKSIPSAVYMVQNNLEPDKFYIGQSIVPYERKTTHFSIWNNNFNQKTSPKLQADIVKLGREHFSFHILHECPENELRYWEDFYILLCQPYYNNTL